MSTNSAVAEPYGDSYRGRYVHWDGYPKHMGSALWALVGRDGLERVRSTVLGHLGWSKIEPDMPKVPRALINKMKDVSSEGRIPLGYGTAEYEAANFCDDGRFIIVPGYGIGYTDKQFDDAETEAWIVPGNDWGQEWLYILGSDALVVCRPDGEIVATCPWTSGEPDWEEMECRSST